MHIHDVVKIYNYTFLCSGGSRILERGVQVCGQSPHWRVSGPLQEGLGACSPTKFLKNGCSEMHFLAFWDTILTVTEPP